MPQTASVAPLKLYLLGTFRLETESGPVRLTSRKAQSLLAYLVLHPEKHSREKLAALFWGDVTDLQARDSLRTALKTLRAHLGDELFITDRETVQLNPSFLLWVDARAFQDTPEVELYRGDLLADSYEEWIFSEREHYRTLYLETLLNLAQQRRARGDYADAIQLAQKILASDPTNESAHQQLMQCYLANGNRQAALKQYEECKRILRAELDIDPSPETTALSQKIKQSVPAAHTLAAPRTNVPIPLTSFIGRQKEIEQLKHLLAHRRLITLTGAGGSGKTRLAIQLASDRIDQYPDGVWWADLAALVDERLVPQAVAKVLGIRDTRGQSITESLKNVLHVKQLLLVLDNCEHLIAACAQLAEILLTHCAELQILATSREALGITGEQVYPVPTLSLPALQTPIGTASLLEYEAIRLFVARAGAVNPDFRLTAQNATAVFEISRQLDGIPLAIELAAARTRVLSVEQIAARLNDRFNLLTQGSRTALPRQQTLRATMDWGYDLLPDPERLLFRRLSVFVAGFSLEAAEAVCSEEPLTPSAVFDHLARLVDRSLVKFERQHEYPRYRMLETVREYAYEKLSESGETERLRQRHRNFFVRFAEEAEPKLKGAEQFEWLDRLEVEHDNLRAAWNCALQSDVTWARRSASALFGFWFMQGNLREAREWLNVLVEQSNRWEEAAARAHVLGMAGWLANYHYDLVEGRALLEQAVASARHSRDKREIAFTLLGLGSVAHRQFEDQLAQGYLTEALALYQELQDPWNIAWALLEFPSVNDPQRYAEAEEFFLQSLAQFRALGDKFREGRVLNMLGELMRLQGDYVRATEFYEQDLEILKHAHSRIDLLDPTFNLAWALLARGDYSRAQMLFQESMELFKQGGDQNGMVVCLGGFAGILAMTGQLEDAARLFGTVESLLQHIRMPGRDPSDEKDTQHYVAVIRSQLDQTTFEKAWSQGRAQTLDSAVQFALRQTKIPPN